MLMDLGLGFTNGNPSLRNRTGFCVWILVIFRAPLGRGPNWNVTSLSQALSTIHSCMQRTVHNCHYTSMHTILRHMETLD